MSDTDRAGARPDEPDPEAGREPGDDILVRTLREGDLDDLVRIDRHATGQERRGYYEKRLETALRDSGITVSLAAEVEDLCVGFVMGRVYHGEYGRTDGFATLDSIGVDPAFRGHGVGRALLEQLVKNLRALRVERLDTEVEWDHWDLLRFLQEAGFRPAPRLSLELRL